MENIEKKYQDASILLEDIWKNMDWENMNNSRKRGITDEFTAKIRAYARCSSSLEQVASRLCRSFSSKLKNEEILQLENKEEIMEVLREETQIPVLIFQIRREEEKAKREEQKKKK